MRVEIVYEDRDILICHKPAGLATQSARVGQPDVVSELRNHLAGAYLGIVHRLDQPVEGLLAFAKNKKAAAALTRQLEEGTLNKQYCALVYGRPPGSSGALTDYLYKDGNVARVVPEGTPGAKKAVLQYELRAVPEGTGDGTLAGVSRIAGGFACLYIHIDTGRFHQIRCQLAHAGMPILGDQKYGTPESLEESRRLGICHTALCACQIRLQHPVTGRTIFYEIDPHWINP